MRRQFDDVQLGSIELFCLAAEAGSFTAAALEAGVTPAAVSRSISRLEERLGVRLFARTIVERALADGSLVEVLRDFGGRFRPFTLLYPQNRYVPLRVRAFID